MRVPTCRVVWNARVVKRRAAWQVKAEVREAQKKLKQLGVAPPPPKGKPVRADIMKPGTYHALPPRLEDLEHYAGQLRALLERHATRWTGKAFLHNVLAAALDAAPAQERLDRPHSHVTARPVIDNRGYLALALLAADTVAPYVGAAEKKQFARWLELGRRVAGGAELSEGDEALLDREVPLVRQPSRALSRNFTAASATLRVAQGVGLEAEQAEAHNVGGKGAREACAAAVTLLVNPGEEAVPRAARRAHPARGREASIQQGQRAALFCPRRGQVAGGRERQGLALVGRAGERPLRALVEGARDVAAGRGYAR